MLSFYADLWLAIKAGTLLKVQDHAYVKRGTPNSLARRNPTLVGEDSIDFELTLTELNRQSETAKLLVRHLPPQQPQIQLRTKRMQAPWPTSNNGLEVSQDGEKHFA